MNVQTALLAAIYIMLMLVSLDTCSMANSLKKIETSLDKPASAWRDGGTQLLGR